MEIIRRALGLAGRGGGSAAPRPDTLEGHLGALLPALAVECVLDVGANAGQYAGMLRRIGFRGHIVSFEPVAASVRELRERAARDGRWTVLPYALGAEEGEAVIHVARESRLSSVLPINERGARTFPGLSDIVARETVPVRRLDAVLGELPDGIARGRVFLKTDTQGSDLAVLAGAAGCLERVEGLQMELSLNPVYRGAPDFAEALRAIRDAGFQPTGIFPVAPSPARALIDVDCVARRGV
ncbi:MAG: FkbM family methyltransferase [Gemmatimonadota bacterium]